VCIESLDDGLCFCIDKMRSKPIMVSCEDIQVFALMDKFHPSMQEIDEFFFVICETIDIVSQKNNITIISMIVYICV
jgi:hypothetical protein